MNSLRQYLKTSPASDLATTQAFEDVADSGQIGSGQARGFFINEEAVGDNVGVKLWTLFSKIAKDTEHPMFPLASGVVITASDASSYFGMDITKTDGVANRQAIAGLVAMNIMSQKTADKFLAKTLTITKPFINVTQEQQDEAILENSLEGSLESHSYTIGGFPINEPDAYIIKTRELIVDVIFDASAPVNTTVTVRALLLDAVTGIYVPESTVDTVRVSAGSTSKNYRISRSFSARKMKFEAICSHNLSFQVVVREA